MNTGKSKEQLDKENKELEIKISDLVEELSELKEEYNKVQKTNNEKDKKSSQLSKQISSLQKDINNYNKNLSSGDNDNEDLLKKELPLISRLEKKKMQFNDLEKQIGENEKKVEELQNQIDELQSSNSSMKKTNKEQSRRIDELNKSVTDLKTSKTQLETKKSAIMTKINKHLNENAKLTVLIDKIQKELEMLVEHNDECKEENEKMGDELNKLKDAKLIQNNDITQLQRDLKKTKKMLNAVSNISDEFKSVYNETIILYDKFDNFILELKRIKDNPTNIDIGRKTITDLQNSLKAANSQFLIVQQENLMVEQEIKILKNLKEKITKDLENIKSLKQKNEILINHNLQDNLKSKDEFLDIIHEEMTLLRNIRLESETVDEATQEKVVAILNMIKAEQDSKEAIGAESNQKNPPPNISVLSNDNSNKEAFGNSLFLGNDSIISENIYNNANPEYGGNFTPKNNVRKRRSSRFRMKNSDSLRMHRLKTSQLQGGSTVKSRNTSMDNSSFNHLYKHENYYEESELKINWKAIMRVFTKMISFFLKTSSAMVNNISAIINKNKNNRSFQKIRTIVIKLGYKIFE